MLQLPEPARADPPHMRNRFTKRIENRQRALEILRRTASHYRQCALDSAFFAAADGRIDHSNTEGSKFLRDLLRNNWIDGAHVDEQLAGPGSFLDAAGA